MRLENVSGFIWHEKLRLPNDPQNFDGLRGDTVSSLELTEMRDGRYVGEG